MIIRMLRDVCPSDYGIKGQRDWQETVQWKQGEEYNEDSWLAQMFINNDDAEKV